MPVQQHLGLGGGPDGGIRGGLGQQRPAAGHRRVTRPGGGAAKRAVAAARDGAGRAVGGGAGGAAGAEQGAQRGQGVVADVPGPGEVPQGGDDLGLGDVRDALAQLAEEEAVAALQGVQQGLVERGAGERDGLGAQQVGGVGQVQADPAVLAGQRPGAGPAELAGRHQLVQHGRLIVRQAGGQHQLLQRGGGQRGALELLDHPQQAVRAAQLVAAQVLPLRQEGGQGARRHGLHLLAQGGQRAAAQPAQHLGVAPLGLTASARLDRAELARHQAPGGGQPVQGAGHHGGAQAEAGGGQLGGERAVGAGVAGQQVAERVLDRLGEGLRDADRQRGAERVGEPPGVLDGGPARFAGDLDLDGPAGVPQRGRPVGLGAADRQLRGAERAEQAQRVGDALDVLDPALGGEPLELGLQLGQHRRVDQLAQLGLAEQFGQQPGVQREGRGPALGERGVALVEELGDVAEEQRAGEGGGLGGGDLDQPHGARLQVAHQLDQAGDVEDVLQALPDGLQHDREGAELARHLQQLGGALALLPERGAAPGAAPGQQQGAPRALAEPGGEQGRAAHLVGDQLFDLGGVEERGVGADRSLVDRRGVRGAGSVGQREVEQVDVREAEHDAVVAVHHLRVQAVPFAQPGAERQCPGGVHLGAEGGVDDDPPVAQLVAEAFDHDRPVVGQVAGGLALLGQVAEQVAGRPVVQAGGEQPGPGRGLGQAAQLADEGAERPAEFERAAERVALPEREPAGHAGRGGDHHLVVGDLLDPPGAGA